MDEENRELLDDKKSGESTKPEGTRAVLSTIEKKIGESTCTFEKMSDGSTRISGYVGDPLALFTKAGFPFQYDSQTDSIMMQYGMKVSTAPSVVIDDGSEVSAKGATFKTGKGAGNAPDFRPTKSELDQILQLTARPFLKEELKVYYTVSADSNVDRHNDHFSEKAGRKIAKWGYDQPVMKDHNYWSSAGVFAKIFDGAVTRSEDGKSFEINHKIYMLDIPENKMDILGIESGINNKLSVGIRLRRKDYHCDVCAKPMFMVDEDRRWQWCGHITGMELKDGTIVTATIQDIIDMLELSRVTVPAQKFAAVKGENVPRSQADLKSQVKTALIQMADSTPDEGRISNSAKISSVPKMDDRGEVSVENEKKNDTPAADVAASAATPAAEAATKAAEQAASATVEASTELKASAAKFNESVAKLSSVADALAKGLEGQSERVQKLEKSLEESVSHFKQSLAEKDALLKKMLEAHLDLAQKTGVVVGKSVQDMARMVAASKAAPQHRQDAEAKAKADSNGFYEDLNDKQFQHR